MRIKTIEIETQLESHTTVYILKNKSSDIKVISRFIVIKQYYISDTHSLIYRSGRVCECVSNI